MSKESNRVRVVVDAVGLAAVVFSLIFVGIEVRQNTAATRSATQQAIFDGAQGGILEVIGNEQLRSVMVASSQDPEWLVDHTGTPDYLLLYYFYMNRFNFIENARFHYQQGTYPPESWAGNHGWVQSLASDHTMQHFWSELRSGYDAGMMEYMDSTFAAVR